MGKTERLGLGLIGCGSFGLFCLDAFSNLEDVRIAAVADVVRGAADAAADRFAVPAFYEPQELIAAGDVDIVHIATPPSSHHGLAMSAVKAAKAVLCEKPLAVEPACADEMVAAAAAAGVPLAVNFVLRYNLITDAVKAILDRQVLGRPLATRLTNCASDTSLGPDHWFWDKSVSGGIFIEHGVHFFDLYAHWLGPGRVIDSQTETREGTCQEDRVTCTVRHDCGVIASHYHGFDQPGPMDRTDHRIVCEMGDIRVEGWIPIKLTIDAVVDEAGAARLADCCPGCRVETTEDYGSEGGSVTGRGRSRSVTRRISLSYCPSDDKQAVYADSARKLLADQIAYIRDGSHPRRVTEANGRDSLALAAAAARLAGGG